MLNTLDPAEIAHARARGREKILSLTADFRKGMDPLTRQIALKMLYGQRVEPIQKAIENFDLTKYNERAEDPTILRGIMLASFQAMEEVDTICRLMAENRVDAATRKHHDIVQTFADRRKWDLCEAFHTFATEGKVKPKSPTEVLALESDLARKGLFPLDILSSLILPLQRKLTPEGA